MAKKQEAKESEVQKREFTRAELEQAFEELVGLPFSCIVWGATDVKVDWPKIQDLKLSFVSFKPYLESVQIL